ADRPEFGGGLARPLLIGVRPAHGVYSGQLGGAGRCEQGGNRDGAGGDGRQANQSGTHRSSSVSSGVATAHQARAATASRVTVQIRPVMAMSLTADSVQRGRSGRCRRASALRLELAGLVAAPWWAPRPAAAAAAARDDAPA